MASLRCLVTGGAGFIGSHIVDGLIKHGHKVRILDNLDPQVHGPDGNPPAYLNPKAEFVHGDVRDRDVVLLCLQDIDVVFHEAGAVGVGQSMYEIEHYVECNTLGTAILLDVIINEKLPLKKLIVAGSQAAYGEGTYECDQCGIFYPDPRTDEQLGKRRWEMRCPHCDKEAKALPTLEDRPQRPHSIYALGKLDQERMVMMLGAAYGIPAVSLRYFNVYGDRQALSNPYTGVTAMFASRLLNDNPPLVFEDGLQSRDFIHVSDVVEANLLAMTRKQANHQIFNIGEGKPTTVLGIALLLADEMGKNIDPKITGEYRPGDLRHSYGDISKARKLLHFKPKIAFQNGVEQLIEWVKIQQAEDRIEQATEELRERGLLK